LVGKYIVDNRSFFTSITSVIYVMIVSGIVSPHISLVVLSSEGLLWVSLLTLGFMLARSYSSILHAKLYNMFSARITGLIGLLLLIVCYISYSSLPPITYPLVKLLEGFAAGLFWPLMQSLLVIGVRNSVRSRFLSIYFLIGNISGFLGYQIGSLIYIYLGSHMIINMGILLLILYLIIYFVISPSSIGNGIYRDRKSLSITGILGEAGRLKLIVFLTILVGGINGLLKDYLFAYTRLLTGFSEPILRNYWSITGYTGLVLSILFTHLYEGMGYRRFVLWSSTIFTLSITLLIFVNDPVLVFSIIVLAMLGTRILRPLLRGIASSKASRPENGIAIVNSLANISAGIVPFIIGLISIM
jgi:hypothetical protein